VTSRRSEGILLPRPTSAYLAHDVFRKAVGGNEFSSASVQVRKASFAGFVKNRHAGKVYAKAWIARFGDSPSPALL
jgi:hypothetical protein